MKTDVEELSPTRVKLTIEVPFDELKASLDKAYREVGKQVRMPGFRPGPCRRGSSTSGSAAASCWSRRSTTPSRSCTARRCRRTTCLALGQPDLEITKLDDGKQLAFTAEVDVRPKFELPDIDRAAGDGGQRRRHPGRGRGVHRRPAGAVRVAAGRRPAGRRTATTSPSTCPPRWTASRSRTPRRAGSPTRWAAARCWTAWTRR